MLIGRAHEHSFGRQLLEAIETTLVTQPPHHVDKSGIARCTQQSQMQFTVRFDVGHDVTRRGPPG